jgi:hypothetical protein
LDHGHTQTFAELRSLPLGLSNFVSVATGHTTPFSEDSKADVLAIPGSSFFTHSIQLGKLGVHYSKTPRLRSRQAARINTSGNQVGLFLQLENIRRCLLLELASAAFQHERNGQFPRTIEQLVPEYLPTAPVNCGSGQAISLWWADTSSGAVPLNGTDENSTSRILSHWSIATRNPGTVAVEINFDSVPRFVQISR